jgi:hypothetical protein
VNYYYPQNGIIASASLDMYIDGTLKPNGTAIDWGTCQKGTVQTKSNVTVVNTGNQKVTVTITTTGLPQGWILEWQANNTLLMPDYKVEGWLNLTIPETWTVEWDTYNAHVTIVNATVWPTWSFSLNGNA